MPIQMRRIDPTLSPLQQGTVVAGRGASGGDSKATLLNAANTKFASMDQAFAPAPAPVYNTAPTPAPRNFSAPAPSAPMAPAPTEADYLAGDSQYNLQLSALMKALQNQQADSGAQTAQYGADYNSTLGNLGWVQDNPATPQNEGAWNFGDLNSAAGRSFNNQQNDFAGRGLLQSSLYGTANDNLTRSLNDQLGGVNTAKQSFMDNLARQSGAFASDNQNQMQQAKIESLARRANGVSLA